MTKRDPKRKNPILLEFAKKVRTRRNELGLTQEMIAEKGGFHVNYIGGIERAVRNPSLTSLIKLGKALDLDPRTLLPE